MFPKSYATAVAIVALVAIPFAATAAQPTDPTAAAVFAGGTLTFGGFATVSGAATVANGNVTHAGGGLVTDAMYGGGSFTYTGGAGSSRANGDWLFNGSITDFGGPGAVFAGNVVSAQGSVNVRATTSTNIQGNVLAAGDFNQPFNFARVGGNVLAGGSVNINGTVGGNVQYGTTYTAGTFASVGGTVAMGGAVTPAPYQPLTLPAGSNLTANANNVTLATFETRTLAPGTYGTLAMASGNTVNLSAGTYVFAGVTNTFSLNTLNFDTTAGPIRLYIDGDFNLNFVETINGLTGTLADYANVTIETRGAFTANADFVGTVFAPNGSVTLNTFADVTGRVLAGGNVVMAGSNTVTIPEPASLAVMLIGGLSLLRRRAK